MLVRVSFCIQELFLAVEIENVFLMALTVVMEQADINLKGFHIGADFKDLVESVPDAGGTGSQQDTLDTQFFRMDYGNRIADDQGITLIFQLLNFFLGIMPGVDNEDVIRKMQQIAENFSRMGNVFIGQDGDFSLVMFHQLDYIQ